MAKEAKRCLHLLRTPRRGGARGAAPAGPDARGRCPPEPPLAGLASGPGRPRRARRLAAPRRCPAAAWRWPRRCVSTSAAWSSCRSGLLGRKEWRAFAKGLIERGAAVGRGGGPARAGPRLDRGGPRPERAHRPARPRRHRPLAQPARAGRPRRPRPAPDLPPLGAEEERARRWPRSACAARAAALPRLAAPTSDFLRRAGAAGSTRCRSPRSTSDERQRRGQLEPPRSRRRRRSTSTRRAGRGSRPGSWPSADHLLARGCRRRPRRRRRRARPGRRRPGRDVPFARMLLQKAFARRPGPARRRTPPPRPPPSPLPPRR